MILAVGEDERFREYLAANGFDVSLMGLKEEQTSDAESQREKEGFDSPSDEEKEKVDTGAVVREAL